MSAVRKKPTNLARQKRASAAALVIKEMFGVEPRPRRAAERTSKSQGRVFFAAHPLLG